MHTVQHILDKKGSSVTTIDADATVLDAAGLMNERHIGALVVTRRDKVIGILSERDILKRVVAAQSSPAKTVVKDVMTTPVACCHGNTSEAECRAVMSRKRIRYLTVVEEDHLVGIISIGDIVAHDSAEKDDTIHWLH